MSAPHHGLAALTAAQRRRGPDCASDLTLDRLACAELSPAEAAAVTTHLGTCAVCQSASDGLDVDRKHFLAEASLPTMAADAVARAQTSRAAGAPPWLRRFLAPLALGAAAAAALVLWVMPRSDTRAKGDFSLSTYVLHKEGAGPGTRHLGEPLHPGDRLQFRYNGTQAGYLAIVALDERGTLSVYYPPGERAERVEAGREIVLRTAVELDATTGREIIVGVRCGEPVAIADILAAAQRAQESARARGATAPALAGLDIPCVTTGQEILKSPRP